MNIIKFVTDRDELERISPNKGHYLLGFYRINSDIVLFCSIAKDSTGFEYYYIDNFCFLVSEDNAYETYLECYQKLMESLESLGSKYKGRASFPIGLLSIHETINKNTWRLLEIEEPYPNVLL